MNRGATHDEPYGDDSECRTLSSVSLARLLVCAAIILASSATSALADSMVYESVGPTNVVNVTNVSTNEPVHRKPGYHMALSALELKQVVSRAAQQHHVHPALLLAVMKAESSFNPTAISKAGAVGLMQLIPETAIRHGVRHLYDANENVTGGAKHLRYLLDRFHGNIRLALAAYNAGERKVDRYGQIPPYKETQDYVNKVLVYYRSYKKDGWVMPVVTAAPSPHAGRPY
jgi:soluble lytic murein transglycosylase-like protein